MVSAVLLELIQQIRRQKPIKVWAVATMFDRRTSFAHEVFEDMQGYFGDMMLSTVIRRNVRLAEASSYGEPITQYAKSSYGAEDYTSLADEVVRRANS